MSTFINVGKGYEIELTGAVGITESVDEFTRNNKHIRNTIKGIEYMHRKYSCVVSVRNREDKSLVCVLNVIVFILNGEDGKFIGDIRGINSMTYNVVDGVLQLHMAKFPNTTLQPINNEVIELQNDIMRDLKFGLPKMIIDVMSDKNK